MKKVVIIGGNEFQNPLILKAKSLGYETHVFAWKNGDIGEKNADYFYPISIIEKELILEQCQKINPDAIVSIGSDLAVSTVNYVANKLELIANNYCDSLKCTNKYEMRRALENFGLEVPKYIKVASVEELNGLAYPKIVKPTDRSGSRAIALVTDNEGLKIAVQNAINVSFEKCAIIEDVIDGDREYSCETISYNGEHYILAVTKKYTTGFPSCIEIGHLQPSDLNKDEIEELERIIPQALNALDIKYGPAHSEFIIDNNGCIHIIEIGARMGGDCIGSNLVMLSTGYDYLKMTIDIALGNKPDFIINNKYNYSMIKFIFNKSDLKMLEEIKKNYPEIIFEISKIKDLNNSKVIDSSSRFGFFIMAFDDECILKYLLKEVKIYE